MCSVLCVVVLLVGVCEGVGVDEWAGGWGWWWWVGGVVVVTEGAGKKGKHPGWKRV